MYIYIYVYVYIQHIYFFILNYLRVRICGPHRMLPAVRQLTSMIGWSKQAMRAAADHAGREGDAVAFNEDGERLCDLRERRRLTFLYMSLLSG